MPATDTTTDVDPYQAQIDALRAKLAQPAAPRYTREQIASRRADNDRQYQLGLLGMLSGDEGLAGVGGMLAKQAIAGRTPTTNEKGTVDPLTGEFTYSPAYQAERGEAQLSALLQRQAAGLAQRQQAHDAAAERRQTAVMLAGLNAQNAQALAAMRQGEAASQRAQARADRQQQILDRDTQSFSKRAEDLTPVIYAAGNVQRMLEDYGDSQIPGVGYDSLLGPFNSQEAVLNRQKVATVSNALLKAASGQAVTLSEEARKAAETLSNGRYSEAEFRRGWPVIRDTLNAQIANITAGFDPQAVATYKRRGGNFAPIVPAEDDGAGGSGQADTSGAVDFSALPKRGQQGQPRPARSGGASGSW